MVLLIDRDILTSLCEALEVKWEVINGWSALFYSADGPPDYAYCRWEAEGPVTVEIEVRELLPKIWESLERKEAELSKAKERAELLDQITALVAVRRVLE